MKKILVNLLLFVSGYTVYSQNNALSFDGADDQVYFTTHGLSGATDFTIEVDVMNKLTAPNEDVFLQFYDVTNGRFELRFDSGKLSVLNPITSLETLSSYAVLVDTYFHITFVKSADSSKLYVNGLQVLSFKGSYTLGSTLKLGRYFANTGFSFTGELDELRLWNKAKSTAEVVNSPCSLEGSEANLVGYYDFNQGVAGGTNTGVTTLTDKSPVKINGTLSSFALAGNFSNWVSSTDCSSTVAGIEEGTNTTMTAFLYPNPATNWVEIKNADANSRVEIFSTTGELLLESPAQLRIELPASMGAGTYFARIKGEKSQRFAFIKR